jgi:hypothetical protein
MKLTTVAKVRIKVMLALAICEAIGIFYFYARPSLVEFAFLSLLVVSFITGLLWANWKRRPGIVAVGTLIWPCFCLMGLRCWSVGDHVSGMALAGIPLLSVLREYWALVLRPNPWSIEKQEMFFENPGFKDLFGTIFFFAITPAVLGLAAIRSWAYYPSMAWAMFFGLFAIVDVRLLVFACFLFINRKEFGGNAKASRDEMVDQGGQA